MPRFFADKINDNTAIIEGEDVSHISKALRIREGDKITLCDKKGFDYDCIIKSIDKKIIMCDVLKKYENTTEPRVNITLYQGIPKSSKMEYIIQKCVEVGVTSIVPVTTMRVVGFAANKEERWRKISLEAAKQCGRGIVPDIQNEMNFKDAVNQMAKADLAIIPYECEKDITLKNVLKGKNPASVSIIIGPEGGFDEQEIEYAKSKGVIPTTLGKRILRTETAGFFVISNIIYEYDI